jgi:hypothetical protein
MLEARLGYTARLCLKRKRKIQEHWKLPSYEDLGVNAHRRINSQ